MPAVLPVLQTHPCIKKKPEPIITAADLPYPSSLVFNAGVIKHQGEYIMIFRNDYGTDQTRYEKENLSFAGTSIGIARSKNGIDGWVFDPQPLLDSGRPSEDPEFKRYYDPRIAKIENKLYLCLAEDTRHGLRGTIGTLSDDLKTFQKISSSVPDNRNMVLFPEKIGGEYIRLERPMPVYSRHNERFDIWLSRSPDLIYWGCSTLLLGTERVPWANDKIGPTASPVKTERGWLTFFHAVDRNEDRGKNGWEKTWKKRYTTGMMLLDLHDPSKVLSVYDKPLIAPELPFETDAGFRQNVIFPCAVIPEENGEIKIYYGAADTCICLATAQLEDLLDLLT